MSSPPISPEEFARLISDATDEQLEAGLAANREVLLASVFEAMPGQFDPAAAGETRAVIEWRVTGREGGGADRWQIAVADGTCRVTREGDADPDLTLTMGPVDFLRLVAGVAHGPRLFVFGRLRARGNLFLAARFQTFFRLPDAGRHGAEPAGG